MISVVTIEMYSIQVMVEGGIVCMYWIQFSFSSKEEMISALKCKDDDVDR